MWNGSLHRRSTFEWTTNCPSHCMNLAEYMIFTHAVMVVLTLRILTLPMTTTLYSYKYLNMCVICRFYKAKYCFIKKITNDQRQQK